MEKGTPRCKMADVKTLVEAGKVKATASAFSGARSLGIHDLDGMCAIIMALGTTDFYKSMTTHADHRIWQDVYHTKTFGGDDVYLKLTVIHDVLIVSFNLDSSVEHARVGCWRRVWVIASTWNATAFEEEQHPQTRRQQLNRVRSALTQEVNSIEVTNINFHNGLVKITSGQLRNLGSRSYDMKCPCCGSAELIHDTRDLPYTCKGETTTIPAVTGDFCPACSEVK